MILQVVFWIFIVLILFSLLIYPFIIKFLIKERDQGFLSYRQDDELPFISILIPVFNEEMIIVEKIRSIFYTLYPFNKFEVLVGSDASYDNTNRIMQVYAQNYQHFYFFNYKLRRGKGAVINELKMHAKGKILVITDANVLFRLNTLFQLIRFFRDSRVGFVDASLGPGDLSSIESRKRGYLSIPYGGCYAVRKELFTEIPRMNLGDDLYLNLNALKNKYNSIRSVDAIVDEEKTGNPALQLEREIRIAKAVYQNTFGFTALLWPLWKLQNLGFFSRLFLQALTPFLLLAVLVLNFFLLEYTLYQITFGLQIALLFFAGIDVLFRLFKLQIVFLRFVTSWISKNLVIFLGFLSYLAGSDFGLWQPIRKKDGGEN